MPSLSYPAICTYWSTYFTRFYHSTRYYRAENRAERRKSKVYSPKQDEYVALATMAEHSKNMSQTSTRLVSMPQDSNNNSAPASTSDSASGSSHGSEARRSYMATTGSGSGNNSQVSLTSNQQVRPISIPTTYSEKCTLSKMIKKENYPRTRDRRSVTSKRKSYHLSNINGLYFHSDPDVSVTYLLA